MKQRGSPLIFSLGFFALTAQTLLFRDFLVAFEGNELGLGAFFGAWFLWVALGACGARFARRMLGAHVPLLALLYLPAYALAHTLIAHSRALAGVAAYEVFPYGRMLGLSLLTNAPVSAVTGMLFTLACAWWARLAARERGGHRALPVARVYILETLGAAAGGAFAVSLLAAGVTGQTVALGAALVLSFGVVFAWPARVLRLAPAAVIAVALLLNLGARWDEADARAAWARLLPEEAYRGRFATAQTEYLYGEREGQFMMVSAGGVVEALPDREHAGEVAALTLSQHPHASHILVVGPGGLAPAMAYNRLPQVDRVTWLHPDPAYPPALLNVLPDRFRANLRQIKMPNAEVREWLQAHQTSYDLIVLHLPAASTLVLNRYFTEEFFELVRGSLAHDGVAAVRLSGAANYMGGALANLGASVAATFTGVFGTAALKPGEETWLLGGLSTRLSEAPAELRDRFASIPGAETVFPPEGVPSLYPPGRIAFQRERYNQALNALGREVLHNTDGHPRALFFTLLFALRQMGLEGAARHGAPVLPAVGCWVALAAVLLFALLRAVYLWQTPRDRRGAGLFDAGFLVFSMGLAAMALSIVLMFVYQVRNGSLYLYVGLMSALFMAGSFAGGTFGECVMRRLGREPPWLLPALLLVNLGTVAAVGVLAYQEQAWLFAMTFGMVGATTGACFPAAAYRMQAASRDAARAGAALEAFDHFGATVGAAATGLFLLPVLGREASLGVLAALIAANLPATLLGRRREAAGDLYDRAARPLGYLLFGLAALLLIASNLTADTLRDDGKAAFVEAARALTQDAAPARASVRLDSGTTLEYFVADEGELAGALVFPTRPLAPGAAGYAGPISMAVAVKPSGELLGLRVLESNETPRYLAEVRDWFHRLHGQNIFAEGGLEGVDALSGATLTSEAVLRILESAGPAFAQQALGETGGAAHRQRTSETGIAPGFLWLAVFLAGAVAQRFYPHRWLRRAFLLAALLLLGLWYNFQFSSQQVFGLLSGQWPPAAWTPAFFLLALIPLATVLFGNVYCGYICPFGALQELIGDLRPRWLATDPPKRTWRYARCVKYVLLFFLVVLFAFRREMDALAADPLVSFFSTLREQTVFVFGLALLGVSFFFRRFWCRNLCPAGAFLALLNRLRLLRGLSPSTKPRFCDLGVRNARELDCIRCDRCRHGKK